jgi:hypothetical protein
MTTEIEPVETIGLVEMQRLSTPQLRAELHQAIGVTAASIARVAIIWRELEARGEDLSTVKFALREYMHGIASGRILPETVAALAGQRRVLSLVAELPIVDQKRLIAGDKLTVVESNGATQKSLSEMLYSEVARVIRDGRIRDEVEQRLILRRVEAKKTAPRSGRPLRVNIIDGGMTLRIGRITIETERVIAALRGLKLI